MVLYMFTQSLSATVCWKIMLVFVYRLAASEDRGNSVITCFIYLLLGLVYQLDNSQYYYCISVHFSLPKQGEQITRRVTWGVSHSPVQTLQPVRNASLSVHLALAMRKSEGDNEANFRQNRSAHDHHEVNVAGIQKIANLTAGTNISLNVCNMRKWCTF